MKMNRTEWIVVLLCAGVLGYMLTRPPAQKPATKPSDKPVAAETKPGDAPKPATPTDPAAPPAAPVNPEVPEVTSSIKSGAAEFLFTNKGGGIKQVDVLPAQYSGKTKETLNGKFADEKNNPLPQLAIGALSTGPHKVETLGYTKEAETERSITYSVTDAETGLKVTKKWELANPVEGKTDTDGFGYLWNLTVTLTNTQDKVQDGTWYLYTGFLGRLHKNDWIQPSGTWYADGSAEELDWTKFDHNGFLGIGARAKDTEITRDLEEMVFAGVHNQYYAVLINPDSVKKDEKTKIWLTRQEINFEDSYGHVNGTGMQAGVGMDSIKLGKGESYTWKGQIYTGPRSGTVLNTLSKGDYEGSERRQVMHYGWFRALSRLFLGLLNTFYGWTGIYALSIILLTLLVRTAIWPLHIKATRAMKKMSKLAPMMKEIREKHKDDPQRMNMAVMQLYRDYQVNPLGGCLPLLFQFPIFLGYYNMMKSAVEMRGHSFLWAHDLSMPDTIYTIPVLGGIPINPLPVLMTVSMFIQMKVSPQPAMADNPQMQMQMKIFKVMPFIFMFFCYNFASALALYWTVQNIISIIQTLIMKNQPDPELKKGPPRMSFAERMMAAQKAREQQMRGGGKGPKGPRPGGGGGSAWKKD